VKESDERGWIDGAFIGRSDTAVDEFDVQSTPWHGVSIGEKAPEVVTAYIEIVPTDTVKYEVDKDSGFLKVDRPQRFSNFCPVYLWTGTSNLLR
jgi:hypothetical protein